jgi:SAM-dependent methyltransferase
VIHYQQGLALINELPNSPKRVLDLASGPGAFAFAALKHGASEVIAIDQNQTALQIAGEVAGRYGFPLTVRCQNVLKPLKNDKFDLIIVGHAIRELFPEKNIQWNQLQKNWVLNLFQHLQPSGTILFIDDSFPHANQRLLALRDQLVAEGFPVQAPCVWQGLCPALQANELCYAQREFEKPYLIKEIQRAAKINLSSLKMTYLILRNKEAGWPVPLVSPVYRVISPSFETSRGKRFHLCGTDGKKDLGSHLKEQPEEARAFDFLKRGELISIENVLSKQSHFDITLGSRIKIEAAINKPLPE